MSGKEYRFFQMSWKIKISEQAKKDLAWFRKNEKYLYTKCFDLTLAVADDPHTGIPGIYKDLVETYGREG